MPEVVTLGEPLVQLNAVTPGPLHEVNYFEKHVAGAEANFAVASVRMGLSAGMISRVGDDPFGTAVIQTLRGRGIDTSHITVEKGAFTGIYFVQRSYPVPGNSEVFYYRKGSAASHMSPSDVDPAYIESAKLLHVTGITPAISESCRAACYAAAKIARKAGVKVSLDTNIRLKLWSERQAKESILQLLSIVDIVFTDDTDSNILVGSTGPSAAHAIMSKGPQVVVLKRGEKGASAYTKSGVFNEKSYKVPVVDVIGAGDAFAGVFASGFLKGWRIRKCLKAGNAAGSLVVTVRGDQENIPTEKDLREFLVKLGSGGGK